MGDDPIRVMIVDDSSVVRRAIKEALSGEKGICVVGTASNGKAALEKIPNLKPDVLILDIEMPVLDGFGVLRVLMADYRNIRVIMFSTMTQRGGAKTMEALSLGAHDYVSKPTSANGQSSSSVLNMIGDELISKIRQFHPAIPEPSRRTRPAASRSFTPSRKKRPIGIPKMVAIGISTGGPNALTECLPKMPRGFPYPILIVQHMPPRFTRQLADRLDLISQIKVKEAEEGDPVLPGVAYIAPGDYHMLVKKEGDLYTLTMNQGPRENSCRPSADVLFRSVAEVYGPHALGVIMTGMGQDGLEGLKMMGDNGSPVIAQDETSCVVWGMPGAVVHAGLADKVVPLDQMADTISSCCGRVFA
ncbi:MAG: chemotaxis response regulator protein-glutamate methylesterase [Nitrospiria bacterium]